MIAECTVEVPSSFSSFLRFLFKHPSWWWSRLSWINMQWKRFNVSIVRAIVFQFFYCILTWSKGPFEADGMLRISLLLNVNSRNDQIGYPLSPSSLWTGRLVLFLFLLLIGLKKKLARDFKPITKLRTRNRVITFTSPLKTALISFRDTRLMGTREYIFFS